MSHLSLTDPRAPSGIGDTHDARIPVSVMSPGQSIRLVHSIVGTGPLDGTETVGTLRLPPLPAPDLPSFAPVVSAVPLSNCSIGQFFESTQWRRDEPTKQTEQTKESNDNGVEGGNR